MVNSQESNDHADGHCACTPDSESFDRYTDIHTLVVDGETVRIRQRDSDGSYHYDWVSGPNEGYGFSLSGDPAPSSLNTEQHIANFRGFLAEINPATGFL
ncbi:MAG: hypothetical protein ACTJHU_00560 [Mycetocola sp.]